MTESKGAGEKTDQQCWKVMTKGEKVLLFFLLLSLILLILISTYIAILFITAEKTCESPNCIKASAKLFDTLDFSKPPCTDFEKFICNNRILETLNIKNDDIQKTAIISIPIEDDDSNNLKCAKRFYQACTNTSALEDKKTISLMIERIGGWPLLLESNWKEKNFNWLWFMAEVRRWGIKSDWLVSFDYHQDADGTNLLMIDPPNLAVNESIFKFVYHEEIILQLSAQLGSNITVSAAKIRELIEFEDELAQISTNAQSKQSNYSKISVRNLNKVWPYVNLVEVLNHLARGYAVFTSSTEVVISSESYLFQLHNLLARTSNRTQANYFIWKTVESLIPFASDEIRDIYAKYVDLPSREEHCLHETNRRFHNAIDKAFLTSYNKDRTLKSLETMVNLLRSDTKVNVIGVDNPQSGFSDVSISSDNLIRMINDIQFHADNEFFKCIHRKSNSCVRQTYFDDETNYANLSNSKIVYEPDENLVSIPFGLVYGDFYRWDQPNYINYARIGQKISSSFLQEEFSDYLRGLELAHNAYLKWAQSEGSEDKLPGLNYTISQLFWIHSSTPHCFLEEEAKEKVFGQILNSPNFKSVFECQ